MARHNHPRCVAEPRASLYYGVIQIHNVNWLMILENSLILCVVIRGSNTDILQFVVYHKADFVHMAKRRGLHSGNADNLI